MPTSTSRQLHVAIIMDGNGRWAEARGLHRIAGHQAGADAVRRAVEASPDLGIRVLTLYAFSSDNWKRPPQETSALMGLFEKSLETERENCLLNGVRLRVIGRRDRLGSSVLRAIELAESETACGRELDLRIAIDYSSRHAISDAAAGSDGGLERALGPDVDLLIRTGGERRLSDFLLWESAYAELLFTPRMWPDFNEDDLAEAVRDFHSRQRRFGQIPAAVGF